MTSCVGLFSHPRGTGSQRAKVEERDRETEGGGGAEREEGISRTRPMVGESERDGRTDGRKQSETRRRKRSEGGGGSSIAASITSGERADSSEAICLSFRANLLRPASSLSLSLYLSFRSPSFFHAPKVPPSPRLLCPSAPLRLSSAILDSAPFSHAPPN